MIPPPPRTEPKTPARRDGGGDVARGARRTRLAPSPTGALHLGNARTFLATWLLARQRDWRIALRIEDLDGPRVKRGADKQAIDDLVWLGMNWDDGPTYQSTRATIYRDAIDRLVESKDAYPCVCSRREAQLAASAPHIDDAASVASVYPGTCRDRFTSVAQARALSGREPAIRFRVPRAPRDETIAFDDGFRGTMKFENVGNTLGDFVIAKSDGTAAYQLAVVIDDAKFGVTDVVRGDDLLDSTPRQILLYRALGLNPRTTTYAHLPLVVGRDGKRLAKRHGDTRLSMYRENGVTAQRMLALLAKWLGVSDVGDAIELDELAARFDLARLSKDQIVFGPSDHAWLLKGRA